MKEDIKNLLPKEEALRLIFDRWNPEPEIEETENLAAVGRVLARDLYARYNIPVCRASAMDGIAVRSADFASGTPDASGWKRGVDYVRADTGDDFDDAFDMVIPIEQVTFPAEGGVAFRGEIRAGAGVFVRPCGSSVREGDLLGRAGTVLHCLDVAAIGMGGYGTVPVLRKPRVAFLPSGSELVPPGTPLKRGQNYETNSVMAAQMIEEMGGEPVLFPIVRDDREALDAAIDRALAAADLVLVNAGTSKGEEDYCARLLEEKGEMLFHGVAAVPGRPMSVTMVGEIPVMNLSGPAFAAFYSMDWALRAMLAHYYGIAVPERARAEARLTAPFGTPPSLSLLGAFSVERAEDGTYRAAPLALRGPGSSRLSAILRAEAVYASSIGEKPHEAGETLSLSLLRNPAHIR